jgi:hypothetical protein
MLIVGIDERPVNVKDGNGGVCHSRPLPANPVPNRAVIRKGHATGHTPIRIVTGRRLGHTAHARPPAYGFRRHQATPATSEVHRRYPCATKRSFICPAERGEIGGISLDPMADPEPKGPPGENSMPGNQRSCPGVQGGALGDLRDMAKAGLPEA